MFTALMERTEGMRMEPARRLASTLATWDSRDGVRSSTSRTASTTCRSPSLATPHWPVTVACE